jgi:DnaJ like chaperone protein
MGVFGRIADGIASGAGAVSSAVQELRGALRDFARSDARRETAFAIAMIALSAKMAKADGVVSRSEVDAFCRLFTIPPGEAQNVRRFYNLAKRDAAGFEAYARDVVRILGGEDRAMLEDLLDGLFRIAVADGAVHEREITYLARVAEIFGFDSAEFERIRARHVTGEAGDPYVVLGADPGWDDVQLRRHYRRLVAENHPDRLLSRGVPAEFLRIANDRLAAINVAWDRIERLRSTPRQSA